MNRRESKGRPTFFWQPVFILLPVVGLACFGLYSMRQDRLLAEQEAHESGQALAQQLVQAFSTEAVKQLSDYRIVSTYLHACHSADLRVLVLGDGPQVEQAEWQRIEVWQHANPEIDLSTLAPVDGALRNPPETLNPRPAEWLTRLNPEQERLWQTAQELEFVSRD